MSLNRLRWAAYYRFRGLRAKAWLFYYQNVLGLSRVNALAKLINKNVGKNN